MEQERESTDNGGGRFRVSWLTAVAWIVAALLAYGTLSQRVSVLETENMTIKQQLQEIRTDIKELLRRP